MSRRRALGALAAVAGAALAAAAALLLVAGGPDAATAIAGPVHPGTPDLGRVRLRDVAAARGLDVRNGAFRFGKPADVVPMLGTGLCWLDADGDGLLDLYVVNDYALDERGAWLARGGLPTSRLYRNTGGRFVDATAGSGAGLALRGQGCVAADLDRDGRTDLVVTTAETTRLLWNEGGLRFREGSADAGLDAFGWFTGAAVGDVDGDGWPDVVLSGYADLANRVEGATQGFPNTNLGVRDRLYLSDGARGGGRPTFREVGADAGLEAVRFEYGLGVVLADLDRDGDLDVYLANDTNPNRLYENVPWPGGAAADPAGLGFRFEERAAAAGVADAGAGMGVAAGDEDGDGRTDLLVTNARGQAHAVFRSLPPDEHAPTFADARDDLGAGGDGTTAWGAVWADLDLDTDLDLVLAGGKVPVTDLRADAQPLIALENLTAQGRRGRFADASREVGLAAVGPRLARAAAAADYDNDGDVDIAVSTVGGPLLLLESTGARGGWLEVSLEGFHPGAEVTVVLPDGRRLRREVHAGSSYLSSEDPRCHFGLGTARSVREVVVRWPGGAVTRIAGVAADTLLRVREPS